MFLLSFFFPSKRGENYVFLSNCVILSVTFSSFLINNKCVFVFVFLEYWEKMPKNIGNLSKSK